MIKRDSDYYFIDIDLSEMRIVNMDIRPKSQVKQHTGDPNVHRIFLTKGQYNKFASKAD